ncbi:MAG TPA: hypothetical protein VIL45_06955 [Thermoplasmata archaeon]
MASLDELIEGLFASLGPAGSLLVLLVIFAVDAAVFPALPEAWIVLTYSFRPAGLDAVSWAAVLLAMAVIGDLVGTSALYAAVRRLLIQGNRMPKPLERAMRRWTQFLLLKDERIILLNRVAPVVPFVGAFIATLDWNVRKAIVFVLVGGLVKYTFLLFIVFVIGVAYDLATARWITLGLVIVVVAASILGSWLYRRRLADRAPP